MGWEFVKLGDLVHRKIGYGIVQPGANVDVGVPVIKVNNIISGLSNIELLEKTTTDIDARYTRTRLVGGELVISLVGSVGKTAIVPKTFAGCNLVRATGLIDIKDEILAKWVKYYIDSPQGQAYINSNVNTTVQVTLNIKSLSDMPIPLPDHAIREKIVAILSSLDDKIELNRRINANLEQQAQALYKSWFVDNKKDDWEEKRLDDIISIYDSQRKPLSGQQREKMEKIYPYYGAASLMDYVDNYLFDGIYLLLGEDGTVSDSEGFPMLQYVWGKFWVNNHAHILQGKNGFTTESLYILLKQTNVSSIVTGAVQPKISQANLKSVPITMPPINLLNQYNNIIKPIFNQIRINHNQIQQLSTLRDTLLPKLMSGEIKV